MEVENKDFSQWTPDFSFNLGSSEVKKLPSTVKRGKQRISIKKKGRPVKGQSLRTMTRRDQNPTHQRRWGGQGARRPGSKLTPTEAIIQEMLNIDRDRLFSADSFRFFTELEALADHGPAAAQAEERRRARHLHQLFLRAHRAATDPRLDPPARREALAHAEARAGLLCENWHIERCEMPGFDSSSGPTCFESCLDGAAAVLGATFDDAEEPPAAVDLIMDRLHMSLQEAADGGDEAGVRACSEQFGQMARPKRLYEAARRPGPRSSPLARFDRSYEQATTALALAAVRPAQRPALEAVLEARCELTPLLTNGCAAAVVDAAPAGGGAALALCVDDETGAASLVAVPAAPPPPAAAAAAAAAARADAAAAAAEGGLAAAAAAAAAPAAAAARPAPRHYPLAVPHEEYVEPGALALDPLLGGAWLCRDGLLELRPLPQALPAEVDPENEEQWAAELERVQAAFSQPAAPRRRLALALGGRPLGRAYSAALGGWGGGRRLLAGVAAGAVAVADPDAEDPQASLQLVHLQKHFRNSRLVPPVHQLERLLGHEFLLGFEGNCGFWRYDFEADQVSSRFLAHTASITQISHDPEQPSMAVSASRDRTVKVWDLRTSKPVYSLFEERKEIQYAACLTNIGGYPLVFSGGHNESIMAWDLRNYRCLYELSTGNNVVQRLAWLPQSTALLALTSKPVRYVRHARAYDSDDSEAYSSEASEYYDSEEEEDPAAWPEQARHRPGDFRAPLHCPAAAALLYDFRPGGGGGGGRGLARAATGSLGHSSNTFLSMASAESGEHSHSHNHSHSHSHGNGHSHSHGHAHSHDEEEEEEEEYDEEDSHDDSDMSS